MPRMRWMGRKKYQVYSWINLLDCRCCRNLCFFTKKNETCLEHLGFFWLYRLGVPINSGIKQSQGVNSLKQRKCIVPVGDPMKYSLNENMFQKSSWFIFRVLTVLNMKMAFYLYSHERWKRLLVVTVKSGTRLLLK